ncbi:MAG TPA: hypothetical protein EYP85_04440 [Armatimonadetes bacterium]|nr:hypothetical protein [Armatimonadota bacterium]
MSGLISKSLLNLFFSLIAAAPAPRPAVLFLGGLDPQMGQALVERGFEVDATGWRETLTWERLRKFNVVVTYGLGASRADFSLPPEVERLHALLHRFLEAGGGVLVHQSRGEQYVDMPPLWAFLNPLGADVPLEAVTDPSTEVVATAWRIRFAYTENLPDSPLREGVVGVWYPLSNVGLGGATHLLPLVVDETWTVVLRGGPRAISTQYQTGVQAIDAHARPPQAGGVLAPPLLAIRMVGAGRLALSGILGNYTFLDGYNPTFEGIVLEKGLRGKKSDLLVLLTNLLRWLAEPSRRRGELGGAKTRPEVLRPKNLLTPVEPFAWEGAEFREPAPLWRGLIGARTAYSVGRGTVAEYVAAAKRAGLHWLVFLEDFKELSREEFAQLKRDCAAVSGEDFFALPGFTIEDQLGNHYFAFADGLPYPEAKLLTPDGKCFGGNPASTRPEADWQLNRTILEYTHSIAGHRLTFGTYLHQRNSVPFYDFRNFDSVAVITQRGPEVVEDFTEGYVALCDSGQNPLPLAVTLIVAPEQVGEIARQGYVTVVRKPHLAAVREKFNRMRMLDEPEMFVTNGPLIEDWSYLGPRDYATHGDWWLLPNYRWRGRLRVRFSGGLREVLISDGGQLFRRFLPPKGGQGPGTESQVFEQVFEMEHGRQKNLVLLVTDTAGRKAVSAEMFDRNHLLEEFMCSDRNNQLTYGLLRRKDGTGLLLGGNQSLGTPYKGPYGGEISPAGTFRNDRVLGAPAFDGAPGGEPNFFFYPYLFVQEGDERRLHVKSDRVLSTGDVHVGECVTDGGFPDDVRVYNVWHTLWTLEPTRFFEFRERRHFFNLRPDDPLAVFLWERTLTLKRPLTPKPGATFWLMTGFLYPQQSQLFVLRDQNGGVIAGRWEEEPRSPRRYLTGDFGPGAYVAFVGSPLGSAAVFSLTEGLRFSLGLPGKERVHFGFPPPPDGRPLPAGTEVTVRLLLVGVPRTAPPTTEVVERFLREMGLLGSPAYRVQVEQGKILDQTYVLTVDGQGEGFAGLLPRANLPTTLPLRVMNLQERWSVWLVDRGRRRARPVGCAEGSAWAVIDLAEGDWRIFLGHPFVCDQPEVVLTAVMLRWGRWLVEVHNPTDDPLTVTVRPAAGLEGLEPFTVEVPAGHSRVREVESST